jgi:hypothetical protein
MTKRISLVLLVLIVYAGMAAADEHPPVIPPPPPGATALNKSVLKKIEDDAPVRNKFENREEALSYDYIVNFARRVPDASFRANAQKDLTFAHLLGPEAYKYRGDVVQIEGRLKRVRDIKPTAGLEADGVKHLYEGWVFSELHREHAWCVLFTELPADIPVAEELDRPVSFAGYFYKVYKYPTPDGARRSPLLVGRTIAAIAQATNPPSVWELSGRSIPLLIASIVSGIAALVGLAWWFRRSDRATRTAIERARAFVGGDNRGAD